MTLNICVKFMSDKLEKHHTILTHFLKKGAIMNNV